MALLTVDRVEYEYRSAYQTVRAVSGVSAEFEMGRLYAIVGASGSGKTTLLSLLAGLDVPSGGSVCYQGTPTSRLDRDGYRLEHVSVIYQNFNLFYHLTVLENGAYPLYLRKMPRKEADALAREKLLSVGLTEDQLVRMPNMLSGGEQQRVAIARALALEPDILCFDEPTSALDPELTGEVLKVIRSLAERDTTMIIVTHEMDFARDVADQILFMDEGVIVEQGPPSQVIEHPREERTRRFLAHFSNK